MKNTFKILTSTALTFICSLSVTAQQQICLGTDATVCIGQSIIIEDCNPGTSGGLVLNNPTFVNLTDDSYTGVVNVGFTFSFYGANYTQCVIGSNGLISFDLARANGYCPWALGGVAPLANATFNEAKKSIMPAYHDINPSVWSSPQGEIMYQTIGTAPNRQFIVLYKDIMAFGGGGECTYMGLILNETSNTIEMHLGYKPIAAGWNNGLAIQGVENIPGTVAHTTAGRNVSQWAAVSDSKLYTPTSPTNTTAYTISTIPYLQLVSPNSTYVWKNTLGQTFPYNNGLLTVNPVLPGTTGYFLTLSAASCSNSVGGGSDTTWITGVSAGVNASMTPDICTSGAGSVTATPTLGVPPYVFNWPGLGNNPNATVNNVLTGNYTVQMTDGNGCSASANIFVTDTPANFQGSSTLVSCAGGSNGTATATMVPALGNVSYQWDDANMQTTQTATGLPAGQYTCVVTSDIGCQGVVVVQVTEIPNLTATIASQSDVTCNSGDDGVINLTVNQGTAPYSYSWSSSASSGISATDLQAGNHTITVTDANNCVVQVNGVINEPPALDITYITPTTQICPEDDIMLSVTGTGGSSPHTFTWFQGATQIGVGSQITVDPTVTNTEYCVTLSEACGSPTDSECTIIYFPTPIEPNAVPDMTEKCVPDTFEFFNTSANGGEIATTYWDFGTQKYRMLENGNDSISMYFTSVGTYDLIMTTTSVYGCVYVDTIESIITVKPTPTADFFFSNNPATIFETVVTMQDRSSFDVISWHWDSPYSNPTSSQIENPTFMFPDGVEGQYPVTLAVETELGCVDTITLNFNVVNDILFYAPNAFTPDGDEFNQVWKPEILGIDIYQFDLYIFNRWGQVVWENHDPSVGWDGTFNGKIVQDGMYVWRARVSTPYNDDKHEFSGSINLIR